jgi:hypothetical protein
MTRPCLALIADSIIAIRNPWNDILRCVRYEMVVALIVAYACPNSPANQTPPIRLIVTAPSQSGMFVLGRQSQRLALCIITVLPSELIAYSNELVVG